ncbi:MAG: serine O-acetyltransferase [Candidatus Eremiobacteraeota bacterium]|nr:serine O-acetyltransferase [Candidatus Eremiobacteraeota bacterium]
MGFVDDIKGVFDRDPAANNILEVLTCYPGLHALWMHRIAHFLWKLKIPLIPRLISHVNRFLTGIEIHPGAQVGKRFFIDHGSGVVIGETTEIANNVTLYSEVVLGGTSLAKKKRHPTLEDDVVVGAGAKVLGAILIGKGARVGAGSVVVKSVPAGATVVGIPAKVMKRGEPKHKIILDHGDLPDPIERYVTLLTKRIDELENDVSNLRSRISGDEVKSDTPGRNIVEQTDENLLNSKDHKDHKGKK